MDRWELEAAAAKVTYMRGLLALPLGAVFILVGLTNLEWGPFQSTWLFFVGVAAAGASWVAAARYYNDHYGRVTPGDRPRLRARRMAATGIYGVALIGGPFLDAQVQPSVSLFAALFAVAMLSWYKLCVQLGRITSWSGVRCSSRRSCRSGGRCPTPSRSRRCPSAWR